MPALSDKLKSWLRNLAPGQDYDAPGAKTRIAERIGVHPTDVTKLMKGEGSNMGLDRFERIARFYLERQGRDPDDVGEVLQEVFDEATPRPEPSERELPEEVHQRRLVAAIERLFRDDAKRGRRVFENLVGQDALRCTDLISAVVHEILLAMPEPQKAAVRVGLLLESWDPKQAPKQARRIVSRYAQKYEELQ